MIRVLIADDHEIVRAGLRQFLSEERDIEVAGEAASGEEVMEQLRTGTFDVVVLDISMPDRNGIDTLKLVRQRHPDLPVLILSTFPEDQYAINLIRAGASGYLTKESAPDELVKAIRTVSQGRRYVSPTVAELLIGGLEKPTDQPLHQTLSKREFQIFCKLARTSVGLDHRRRVVPERQDGQHVPHPHPGKDGHEVERRPDVLRHQERTGGMTPLRPNGGAPRPRHRPQTLLACRTTSDSTH